MQAHAGGHRRPRPEVRGSVVGVGVVVEYVINSAIQSTHTLLAPRSIAGPVSVAARDAVAQTRESQMATSKTKSKSTKRIAKQSRPARSAAKVRRTTDSKATRPSPITEQALPKPRVRHRSRRRCSGCCGKLRARRSRQLKKQQDGNHIPCVDFLPARFARSSSSDSHQKKLTASAFIESQKQKARNDAAILSEEN